MEYWNLSECIGGSLSEAEDKAVRKIREHLRRFPKLKGRQACKDLGISFDVYMAGRRKQGWQEERYDPTDIATNEEAFSYCEPRSSSPEEVARQARKDRYAVQKAVALENLAKKSEQWHGLLKRDEKI